jgi:bis(5'-nucleosyl)-tetraphosphatase (symmetrical)
MMATYVIGDIQGCFAKFRELLGLIAFNSAQDRLWLTGDLVNRGPQSLEVLRYVKNLGERHVTVLGNHDLHLLAVAQHAEKITASDTFQDILRSPDREELLQWLSQQPLLYHEGEYVLVHAGLAPRWTLEKAKQLAREVETMLSSHGAKEFFRQMYTNEGHDWRDDLRGHVRLRCIVNFFTRMRFCHLNGDLELGYKGTIADAPPDLVPWFDVKDRVNKECKIIFGHWAALDGKADVENIYPLDTGCVWGNCLTAFRLEDEKRFSVQC